ncbi:MarR family transcriptional regulator [Ottowia sp.]|uniref:MarR family winged helix-turn-helix transcriptional regulator n=1 Tax=Ottowia sp. TaxID=1898956 RepID=UPI00261E232F|nr:MarR family transcriptional regulator [Ottowia sp.]
MTSVAKTTAPASSPSGCPLAAAEPLFKPEGFCPEQSVLYMLKRAMMGLGQTVNREMAMEDPTMPQWLPLFKVWKGDANTVAELARASMIDVSSMTRLLDRLEKKGLVKRERCETDRRVVRISLTPEGRAVAERVPEVLCAVYNRALEGFTADEWAQLRSLLLRLVNRAEAMAQEPGAQA